MKQEAQRIAIAEHLGAKIITKEFSKHSQTGENRIGKKWAWNGDEKTPCAYPGGGFFGFGWNSDVHVSQLPDYPNDANAMRDARKIFTPLQKSTYARILTELTWQSEQPLYCAMDATAAQQAEAFLRTIGKWESPTV